MFGKYLCRYIVFGQLLLQYLLSYNIYSYLFVVRLSFYTTYYISSKVFLLEFLYLFSSFCQEIQSEGFVIHFFSPSFILALAIVESSIVLAISITNIWLYSEVPVKTSQILSLNCYQICWNYRFHAFLIHGNIQCISNEFLMSIDPAFL